MCHSLVGEGVVHLQQQYGRPLSDLLHLVRGPRAHVADRDRALDDTTGKVVIYFSLEEEWVRGSFIYIFYRIIDMALVLLAGSNGTMTLSKCFWCLAFQVNVTLLFTSSLR